MSTCVLVCVGTTELEDDERVVVTGIKEGAFQFLRDALVRSKSFHQEVNERKVCVLCFNCTQCLCW